jgi:hypothetical protein
MAADLRKRGESKWQRFRNPYVVSVKGMRKNSILKEDDVKAVSVLWIPANFNQRGGAEAVHLEGRFQNTDYSCVRKERSR